MPVIDEDADVGYWRARAGRAEARVTEREAATAALRADKAGLTAQVAELAGQVDRLQESVTTLSGLLFGSSSEKGGSPSRGNGRADGDRPGGAGKRGQRPGRPGHGRRDRSHLETEERFIDVDAGQRCCAECGEPFEFLGTEDSEQAGWQVKITRIVWRRRRYRRRCSHPGPRTACAPPAARPVPKGLFTAGFLARLAYEKHVLGRPVHRIVQALAADGFDVAAGTLCGALKQIAPLIAPWAEAIAAHGRQAGHVHAGETSWQVFEDIEDKDGHRWWLTCIGPVPQLACFRWVAGWAPCPEACSVPSLSPDRCRLLRAGGRVKERAAPAQRRRRRPGRGCPGADHRAAGAGRGAGGGSQVFRGRSLPDGGEVAGHGAAGDTAGGQPGLPRPAGRSVHAGGPVT